jgi:HD-GYP domain-containing protein (c-di-GMP phosphodiesterase class II)
LPAADDTRFMPDAGLPAPPPFDALTALRDAVARWQQCMLGAGSEPGLAAQALAHARGLSTLVGADADAVLGALLLDEGASYAEIHPLMVGTLCELVARRLALDADTRASLLAAVFSCNLGLLPAQTALAQPGPLTPPLEALVREHPSRSHTLLRAHGVTDSLWLTIVLQHHERPDGQGYPGQLRGAAIEPLARLVSLADIYSAMVLPREYRTGIRAQQAVRQIFLARGQHVDAALAADFIGEIGVFPPGAFVRLVNGETGVVVRRGSPRRDCPLVSSFRSPRGSVYPRPLWRDGARDPRHAVAEVLGREHLAHSLPVLWAPSS